jgi:hypothetical protein
MCLPCLICSKEGEKLDKLYQICTSCSKQIPMGIYYLSQGLDSVFEITTEFAKLHPTLFPGTWTKDNWESYPTVQKIRSQTPVKQDTQILENPHEGMIYNPVTEEWGWF